jgi:hypothetical protein
VAAVLEALAAIAPGVGIALGGALTALLSPRLAYLVAGLGLIVLVGVGILRRSALSRRGAPPLDGRVMRARSAGSGSG